MPTVSMIPWRIPLESFRCHQVFVIAFLCIHSIHKSIAWLSDPTPSRNRVPHSLNLTSFTLHSASSTFSRISAPHLLPFNPVLPLIPHYRHQHVQRQIVAYPIQMQNVHSGMSNSSSIQLRCGDNERDMGERCSTCLEEQHINLIPRLNSSVAASDEMRCWYDTSRRPTTGGGRCHQWKSCSQTQRTECVSPQATKLGASIWDLFAPLQTQV